MNNKCINLKQKLNGKLECKKQKCTIYLKDCANCKYKEYKVTNCKQIKQRTYKQNKLEKGRYSIIYDNLDVCCVHNCNSSYKIEKNEVYEGAKRIVSIKNGFIIPLCKKHHDQFHNDRQFALYYKRLFQLEYEKTHTRDEFIKLIHYNYLNKL